MDVLDTELEYWGMSRKDFHVDSESSKYQLIQKMIDEPIDNFIVIPDDHFGMKKFQERRMNFKDICKKNKLTFQDDFKIREIAYIFTVDKGSGIEIIDAQQFGKVLKFKNEKLRSIGIGSIKLRNNGSFGFNNGYEELYFDRLIY